LAKDILERYIRLSWDDSGAVLRDLSSDMVPGSLSGPGFTAPEVRMTGVSDQSENYQADRKDAEVGAQFYMNNTATTGAFTVLSASQGLVGTLQIDFGTGGAPSTGDPRYSGEHILLDTGIAIQGGAMVMDARWKPGATTAPAWSTVP